MHKKVAATLMAAIVGVALISPTVAHARRYARRAAAAPAAVVHKAPPSWSYMAKRMRPPKSDKWKNRWNELGMSGWELVGVSENMFIFKRPAGWGDSAMASSAPSVPATTSAPASMPTSAAPKATSTGGRFAPPSTEGATSAPSSESRFPSRYGR